MGEPASRGRRARRKEARPQELLEAALEVFVEKGFSAAKLDEIAARAGVSKGTLYLYFESKEALLEALVRAAVVPNIERVEAMAEGWTGATPELLRRLLQVLGSVLEEGRVAAFPKLVVAESGNFPAFAERYRREVIDRGLGLFARIIGRGVERGEFRPVDPDTTARLCLAPMIFLAIWQTSFARFDTVPFDARAFVDAHIDTLLHGLLAPPETAP
jgi:AcrR family transcriptional regulator